MVKKKKLPLSRSENQFMRKTRFSVLKYQVQIMLRGEREMPMERRQMHFVLLLHFRYQRRHYTIKYITDRAYHLPTQMQS